MDRAPGSVRTRSIAALVSETWCEGEVDGAPRRVNTCSLRSWTPHRGQYGESHVRAHLKIKNAATDTGKCPSCDQQKCPLPRHVFSWWADGQKTRIGWLPMLPKCHYIIYSRLPIIYERNVWSQVHIKLCQLHDFLYVKHSYPSCDSSYPILS